MRRRVNLLGMPYKIAAVVADAGVVKLSLRMVGFALVFGGPL
jgi:hypothetical protein